MKKEFEYIIAVLKDEIIEEQNLDYNWILGFLELNKISAYFYRQTKRLGIKLPQNVDRKLHHIWNYNKQKNALLKKYIKIVGAELDKNKIQYCFLKGSVLSNANMSLSEQAFSCMSLSEEQLQNYANMRSDTFYGEGERISNDIDILVHPKDITNITKVLKALGFVQGYYSFEKSQIVELDRKEILLRRMNRGETAPFMLKVQNEVMPFVEVDVNFSLGFLPNGDEEIISKMLNDPIRYAGRVRGGINSLKGLDFFMHLVAHQYKESILYFMVERNKDLEMYKLLDMYLFIKEGIVSLQSIVDYAKIHNMQSATYYVLSLLDEVFGLNGAVNAIATVGQNNLPSLNEVVDIPTNTKYLWSIPFAERVYSSDRLWHFKKVGK